MDNDRSVPEIFQCSLVTKLYTTKIYFLTDPFSKISLM